VSFLLKTYNVLAYEPKTVRLELKVAKSVLASVLDRANAPFTDVVIPELAKLGLISEHMTLGEFAERAHELPDAIAEKIVIPEEERFVVTATPYQRLGHVPNILGDFDRVYQELAAGGIAVTFFNTACLGPRNDYERLAEIMDQFPAVAASAWVVTTSLREPMPESFRALIERRAGATGPDSAAARRLAISIGSPCYVPIGDSIVIRAVTDAATIAYERLKYLRSQAAAGGAAG
jgi:hypothetical protein